MSECQKCHASVPTHAKVCPECGAPANALANATSFQPDTDDTVHTLLLNAHLMKIRGDSDAAVGECIKALRINPDSVEAHTLLGDIYQDQGNIEEAVHWYKLALDLSPDSRSNRDKLSQISTNKPSVSHKDEVDESESDSTSPKFKFNITTIQSVLIGILILIVITLAFRPIPRTSKDVDSSASSSRYSEAPSSTVTTPEGKTPELQIENRPNTNLAQPPSSLATDPDASTIKELNAHPSLTSNNLQVTSSMYDPRNDTKAITFISPTVDNGLTGHSLVRQGLIVAKEEFTRNASLSRITIRILYHVPTNEGVRLETVFVGDTTREKASQIDPETATYADQVAVFENAWWHQDVK